MEDQDYIMFEAYLSGDLSADELNAFNERLNSDEQFQQAFKMYRDLSSHLEHNITNEQESADFKANLDVISNQYFNKIDDPIGTTTDESGKSNFYKYAIAASVILLLGIFVFNQFNTPTYKDYNNFEPISLTVRSSDNAFFNQAEQSFNAKNYEEALVAFNSILEEDFSNLEIQLYKGIALVETNQFEEADDLLKKLSQGNSAYKYKAKWILALSYLKQENKLACIETLKTIPKEAEDYKRVQDLLKKLE